MDLSSSLNSYDIDSNIINETQLNQIMSWVPLKDSIKEPVVLYSSCRDGFCLNSLYSKTDSFPGSIILLIKTTENEVFGSFCNESFAGRRSSRFFGTGETFLFTLNPLMEKYSWTGSTSFFINGTKDYLSIGSGNGFGLYLDDLLTRGRSEKCYTFNNQPLALNGDFQCISVEVIGLS